MNENPSREKLTQNWNPLYKYILNLKTFRISWNKAKLTIYYFLPFPSKHVCTLVQAHQADIKKRCIGKALQQRRRGLSKVHHI